MARAKITAYVTPDIAETLKRVAAVDNRSVSDIIEDALAQRFAGCGHDAEHAAVMAKLDNVARRLGVLEKGQETHFELSAQAARFAMSVAPETPEADRGSLNARGADRFRNVLAAVVARLASGRTTWREALSAAQQSSQQSTHQPSHIGTAAE